MSGPLSHVTVLDLSRIMAGPWATQILADLGADVIKVERPGVGDDTRGWGPPFLKDGEGGDTKEAGYFLSVNRGKRSITINLETPEGRDVIKALAATADILVENYKVGTLARYGLDYATLRQTNPRLIYASVTGFGQTGPKAKHAAYDFMIQAMGGLMSVTGERDDRPGGGPQKVGVPIVDLMTGMYACVAVLAALARRERTGQGDYIDIAMLDVQSAFLANQAMNYLVSGKIPKRLGNSHPNIQPQDVFECSDGYVAVAVGNDEQFVKFCDVISRPDLPPDPRFTKNADRVRNLEPMTDAIRAALRVQTMDYWVPAFDAAGVPCGKLNTIETLFKDPQLVERGMLRQIAHPTAGTVPQVVSPIRYQTATLAFERPPPLLGQHTREILTELGFDEPGIAQLRHQGAI